MNSGKIVDSIVKEWIKILSKNNIKVSNHSYNIHDRYSPNYTVDIYVDDDRYKLKKENITFIYNYFLQKKILIDINYTFQKMILSFNINDYNNRVRRLKIKKITNNFVN
jgi:hypothetical protein